jgi:undecaprenyl pyrophosphate phosphatase UppP
MDPAALFSAFLMGVVEGLTEFLPISSTGHLILLGELIGFEGPPGKVFEITIQLGAILAVIVLFRQTLIDLALKAWRPGPQRFYAINLALAFLPAAVIGATLHGTITRLLFDPYVVCAALILGGVAIILIERLRPRADIRSVPEIGPLAALLIGFGQALAMIPGTSRSGATIITALLRAGDPDHAGGDRLFAVEGTQRAGRGRPRADRHRLRRLLHRRTGGGALADERDRAHRLHALRLVPHRPRHPHAGGAGAALSSG